MYMAQLLIENENYIYIMLQGSGLYCVGLLVVWFVG